MTRGALSGTHTPLLLFQDLAVVPLLVVTPLLGGTGAQLGAALRLAADKSASALLSIFVVGRFLLQRAYKLVASAKDQTSFLAITLVTVLSMAGFTAALGLSDTLGAFLAGILLAETKYRYQIEVLSPSLPLSLSLPLASSRLTSPQADIAPFRGLLLGLFFITTGFSIDVGLAVSSWPAVVGMALGMATPHPTTYPSRSPIGTLTHPPTIGLHTLKTGIVAAICLACNLKLSVAIRSGLLLSQGGEFAFVIFALAQQHGLLLPRQVNARLFSLISPRLSKPPCSLQVKLLLTTVVITMFLTPFLNEIGGKISSSMERKSGKILLPSPDEAESSDYILICGFGRVGQAVAELLTAKLVRCKRVSPCASLHGVLPDNHAATHAPGALQGFRYGSIPSCRGTRARPARLFWRRDAAGGAAGLHARGECRHIWRRRRAGQARRLHKGCSRAAAALSNGRLDADIRSSER